MHCLLRHGPWRFYLIYLHWFCFRTTHKCTKLRLITFRSTIIHGSQTNMENSHRHHTRILQEKLNLLMISASLDIRQLTQDMEATWVLVEMATCLIKVIDKISSLRCAQTTLWKREGEIIVALFFPMQDLWTKFQFADKLVEMGVWGIRRSLVAWRQFGACNLGVYPELENQEGGSLQDNAF